MPWPRGRRDSTSLPAAAVDRLPPPSLPHHPLRPPMPLPLFLPCAAGVEALLAEEVARLLPQTPVRALRGGVALAGDPREVMLLNLESRLAQRVLIEVAEGPYRDENDLYALARGVAWSDWITPRQTLRVDTTAQRSPLKSLNFAALRVKDAVCDRMRDEHGERPNVDTAPPRPAARPARSAPSAPRSTSTARASRCSSAAGARTRATRRSRRRSPRRCSPPPAGAARRRAGGALHDPCCGSGTIAIEAAQIALRHRAGATAPVRVRAPAAVRRRPSGAPSCSASKVDGAGARPRQRGADLRQRRVVPDGRLRAPQRRARRRRRRPSSSTAATRSSARRRRCRADLPGTLMVNPPYGERIEVARQGAPRRARQSAERAAAATAAASDFFPRLAAHWKRAYTAHPAGWTAWILSPDMKLPSAMRLKESRRVPMWNGPIECRLFRFDLVAGSARAAEHAGGADELGATAHREPREPGERRRVGAQHARAETDADEAARDRGRSLRRREAAFGAAQDDDRARRGRRRAELVAGGGSADRVGIEAEDGPLAAPRRGRRSASSQRRTTAGQDAGDAGAPALLARRGGDRPASGARRASARSPDRRSTERSQTSGWIAARAELAGLLDQRVHAIVGRNAERQRHVRTAARARPAARRADPDLDRAAADADDLARPLGAVAAVEEQHRARPAAGAAPGRDAPRRRQRDDAVGRERLRRRRCEAAHGSRG